MLIRVAFICKKSRIKYQDLLKNLGQKSLKKNQEKIVQYYFNVKKKTILCEYILKYNLFL